MILELVTLALATFSDLVGRPPTLGEALGFWKEPIPTGDLMDWLAEHGYRIEWSGYLVTVRYDLAVEGHPDQDEEDMIEDTNTDPCLEHALMDIDVPKSGVMVERTVEMEHIDEHYGPGYLVSFETLKEPGGHTVVGDDGYIDVDAFVTYELLVQRLDERDLTGDEIAVVQQKLAQLDSDYKPSIPVRRAP